MIKQLIVARTTTLSDGSLFTMVMKIWAPANQAIVNIVVKSLSLQFKIDAHLRGHRGKS